MGDLIQTAGYQVEFLGPWPARAIRLRFDPSEFRPPPEADELIERTFASERRAAAARGHDLFNGKLSRLVRVAATAGGIELTVQPTDFQTFLTTNLIHPGRFAPDQRADAMGVSAVVRSRDGNLLLGRRSERVAFHRGRLHTIGGVLDWIRPPADGQSDGGWLFDQLSKELFEELSLQPEDLMETTGLVLARDRVIAQPELLCLSRVALPAGFLVDRWREDGNHEHVELWTCPDSPAAVSKALAESAGQFTPIAVAALLAHLSITHGAEAVAAMMRHR